MINDENIKDVEFEDVLTQEKTIRGSVLYYSTSQVAQILNIPDSTVRYYTKVFDDILHIEISNKQRRYKNSDIEKLKFIVQLKEEGLTIKQIGEYCSEVSFQEGKGVQIKESNPLSIQTLAKTLMDHQEKQIALMEERIMSRLNESILNQSLMNSKTMEDIKEEICTTVDEIVSEKMNILSGLDNKIASEVKNVVDTKLDIAIESQYRQNKAMFDSVEENVIKATKNEIEGQISGIKKDVNEISKISSDKLDKTLMEISKSVEGIDKQVKDVKKEIGIAYVSMEEIRGKKSLFERLFKK